MLIKIFYKINLFFVVGAIGQLLVGQQGQLS